MKHDTVTETSNRASGNGGVVPNFSLLANGSQQALDRWVQSNEAIMKGSFDLAQQVLSFGQARLSDDLSTWTTLMACRDFGQVTECQKQFAEKAAAQYMDQASKFTSKLTSLLTCVAAPVHKGSAPQA